MGVDLTVYFNHDASQDPAAPYHEFSTGSWFLVEGCRFEGQRELWEPINHAAIHYGRDVTETVYRHEDDKGLRTRTDDPYGAPLRTLRIRELVAAMVTMEAELYHKNRAILTYLRALPQEARVLLWWH